MISETMLCCVVMQTLLHILIVNGVTINIVIRVPSTTLDALKITASDILWTAGRIWSAVKCVLRWID